MSVRRCAVAIVAVLTLALTGCGSDGGAQGAAAGQSQAADGLDLGSLSTGDTVRGGDLAALSSAAVQDAKTVRVTMAGASSGGTLKGAADFSTQPASITFAGNVQGEDLTVLLVDGILYIKTPAAGAKPWIKIDPNGDSQMSQMVATMLEPLSKQSDPTWLMSATGDAELTVTATDGDTVSFEQKLTEKEMSDLGSRLYGSGFTGQASGDMTVTTTVDNLGRPTKIVVSTSSGDQTMQYSDWGAKLDISAPPEDQVGELQTPDFGDLQSPTP